MAAIGALNRLLEEIQANLRRRGDRIKVIAQDAVQIAERIRELSKLRGELGTVATELAAVARIIVSGEDPAPVGSKPGPAPADGRYSGRVQVEVGPLRDFSQLTSFEDAASSIDAASDVQIRNFADGRATFSMNFAQPVELVRELEGRIPFQFSLRSAGAEGVVLDLNQADRAA